MRAAQRMQLQCICVRTYARAYVLRSCCDKAGRHARTDHASKLVHVVAIRHVHKHALLRPHTAHMHAETKSDEPITLDTVLAPCAQACIGGSRIQAVHIGASRTTKHEEDGEMGRMGRREGERGGRE